MEIKPKHNVIGIRLNDEDNAYLEEQVKLTRLSKSSWIRNKIFDNGK